MQTEIPQPLSIGEMRQKGTWKGTEIADALMELIASEPSFSVEEFEPDLRDRFAAWMGARRQVLAENWNMSEAHLTAWCEAAENALYLRIGVYRKIIATRGAII
jgi:hypothetical protein